MEITYQLTERDFRDSIIAHRNRTAFAKWSFRIMLLAGLIAGAAGVFLLTVEPSSELRLNAAILVAVAVFWAGCKWARPWWAAQKQFRNQPSAQGLKTAVLDSDGMHLRWEGGSSNIGWNNVIRCVEGQSGFLLYTSPVMFMMIPKRALPGDQLAAFRSLIAEHVPASKSR